MVVIVPPAEAADLSPTYGDWRVLRSHHFREDRTVAEPLARITG